ncbi:MAG: Hpt domain-containing protein, partial [Proteobacteria bacterium]|nr:Hpt domain-containing protein [Pseudomonadota bacterium]
VRGFAPVAADWFEMSWADLAAGALPIELCLAQLPSRFVVGGRHLIATYQHLTAADGTRVLVVISDETAAVERAHAERDEREVTTLVTRMLHDRTTFLAFCAEADRAIAAIQRVREVPEVLRAVHTLKGMSAMEGISSLADLCHELETSFAEREGPLPPCDEIVARWAFLRAKVAHFLEFTTDRLDLSYADLDRLELAIARHESYTELERQVATWRHDRIRPRLERYADQVRILASQLCKDPIEVHVEGDPDLRLPPGRFRGFWSTFVHAIRNAVDHGIETSAERASAGKPAVASITFRAFRTPGKVTIQLEDRGRGIDWERIAARARTLGLPAESPQDLENALCHDGLSTREQVTEVSGRGVGFGAFRQACERSGARLQIASTPGRGTTLTMTWSDELLAAAPPARSLRHPSTPLEVVR